MAYRRDPYSALGNVNNLSILYYTPIHSACKPNYSVLQSYYPLAPSYNINIENFRLEEPGTQTTGTHAYANTLLLTLGLRAAARRQE